MLDKNVLKSVSGFLKLIDSLVEGEDMVKERRRWDRGGRCEARLDMFSKAERDKGFLIKVMSSMNFQIPELVSKNRMFLRDEGVITGATLVSQISCSRETPKCLKMRVNKFEYGSGTGCMNRLIDKTGKKPFSSKTRMEPSLRDNLSGVG